MSNDELVLYEDNLKLFEKIEQNLKRQIEIIESENNFNVEAYDELKYQLRTITKLKETKF